MNLRDSVPFTNPRKVRSGDYRDLAGSKAIVLCAGVGQMP